MPAPFAIQVDRNSTRVSANFLIDYAVGNHFFLNSYRLYKVTDTSFLGQLPACQILPELSYGTSEGARLLLDPYIKCLCASLWNSLT